MILNLLNNEMANEDDKELLKETKLRYNDLLKAAKTQVYYEFFR